MTLPQHGRKLATLAVTVLLATSGLAWANGTARKVTAKDVMIRDFKGSYTIGRLTQGQVFDVQATPYAGWYWGYAHGHFNGCGFIQASAAPKSSSDKPATGGKDCGHWPTQGREGTLIATGLVDPPSVSGGGTNGKAHNVYLSQDKCAVYGNPHENASDIFRYTHKTQKDDRYMRFQTRDKKMAMVQDRNFLSDQWGYVLNSCLKPHFPNK